MNKPVIGITGNEKAHPDDELMMSYAAKGFVEGVKEAGGIPIILPIGDEEMASYYISLIDKLILTGGQNVDPKYYGEPKAIDSDVKTAILTVPSIKSQEVAELLVDAGIKGILSFSPVHLHLPKDVVVQYVDLTSELQTLLYFMRKED